MGILDSAKDKFDELKGSNSDSVDKGVDFAGDQIDERTDGAYSDKVDAGQDFAKDRL